MNTQINTSHLTDKSLREEIKRLRMELRRRQQERATVKHFKNLEKRLKTMPPVIRQ